MKTRIGLCVGVWVLVALTAPVIGQEEKEAASPWDKLGKPAAPLSGLRWIKGEPVKMEKGSVYVVEFWATWCGPCLTSIPHLTEVQDQFKDRGVTIIGISTETADKVKPFVAEKGDTMNYTVAIDPGRQVSKGYMGAFGVRGIPHAFIVGKNGNLLWHGHPMAGLDDVLEQVVAGSFDYIAYAKKQAAEEKEQVRVLALYKSYFTTVETDRDEAARIGRQLVEGPDNPMMLNALAWRILTDVPQEHRDLELARQAAAKAVKLTEEKNPSMLDTYARALYELGKKYVADAATQQKKAIALVEANDDMPDGLKKFLDGLKKTLERYESASVQ